MKTISYLLLLYIVPCFGVQGILPLDYSTTEKVELGQGPLTTPTKIQQPFEQLRPPSDTIQEQLKTAERMRKYMEDKNYEDAILLFSKEQQQNILEIKKNEEMFAFWCMVWTFDEAKYERYVANIKAGRAHFIFEDDEWKINEK